MEKKLSDEVRDLSSKIYDTLHEDGYSEEEIRSINYELICVAELLAISNTEAQTQNACRARADNADINEAFNEPENTETIDTTAVIH